MKIPQPNNYHGHGQQSKPIRRPGQLRRGGSGMPDITLQDILHYLAAGLLKLWVAIKYQFHRFTGGAFLNIRLPWYKLALAGLAFFILTKKDIQFSINMKAPLSGFVSEQGETEQMSLVQPVTLKRAGFAELDDQKAQAYIQRFGKVARMEMEKFGIPASIKMAQALLESQAGQQPDALQHNNHFGPLLAGRHFDSAWENWRAHSLLLQERYPDLFKAGASYKNWARGLQRSGYSSNQAYDKQLLDLIEKYQLFQLDEV